MPYGPAGVSAALYGYCPASSQYPANANQAPCDYSAAAWSLEDYAARSRHPGGVMTGFADGSVHFVTDEVDLSVWQGMASIAGGEVLSAAALGP